MRFRWRLMRTKGALGRLELLDYVATGFPFSLDQEGLLADWDFLGFELKSPPIGVVPSAENVLDDHSSSTARDQTQIDDIVIDHTDMADTTDEGLAPSIVPKTCTCSDLHSCNCRKFLSIIDLTNQMLDPVGRVSIVTMSGVIYAEFLLGVFRLT